MRFSEEKEKESGFTIHELLVVIAVGSIVVSAVLFAFMFGHKSVVTWRERTSLRNIVETAARNVANDISRSRSVVALTDTSLILARETGLTIAFTFSDNHLRYNGVPINPKEFALQARVERSKWGHGGTIFTVRISGRGKLSAYESETKAILKPGARGNFLQSMPE